jgi:hypothetical protein
MLILLLTIFSQCGSQDIPDHQGTVTDRIPEVLAGATVMIGF